MAEFMLLMKGEGGANAAWNAYIKTLMASGLFRGGSALANGVCVDNSGQEFDCSVNGFMRFEADDIDQVRALLTDNPLLLAGGKVELLELVQS